MPTIFSLEQIKFFKRQARKACKEKKIKNARALDDIAEQQGFKNWSLLMQNAEKPATAMVSFSHLLKIVTSFIENFDDDEIFRLIRHSGSIWIHIKDAQTNKVDKNSLIVLGNSFNGAVTQYASQINATILYDASGLSDLFVFEDDYDEDDDDGMIEVGYGVMRYTPQVGRKILFDSILNALGGEYDGLCTRLDDLANQEFLDWQNQ
ncbi:hypothetical protein [Undibacterium sp. TJN19]|uniref:hypothetical protein n=1 Tax=Undibacterium sp. TJN19 TaxID=3413055 RepID=UPI003BF1AF73